MSLKERLKAQIAATGPISVAQYMIACLHDPQDGYYATRPKLGEDGDFITAPLISQMFGELLGLWAVEAWERLGRPIRVVFAEVGPGDGTLMADALRAAQLGPGFLEAVEVWLVEASPVLAAEQKERLGGQANWVGSLKEVPTHAPLILIANELLDCLPAQQFVQTTTGWAERVIGLDDAGELTFGLRDATFLPPLVGEVSRGRRRVTMGAAKPESIPPSTLGLRPSGHFPRERGKERASDLGAVMESSPAQEAFGAELAARITRTGGAALLIDYGRDRPEPGDTLQALRRHQKVDPLACPGEADLTVHANFPAVLAAARVEGASTAILTQGDFLRRLGIEARAAALKTSRPDRAETIDRQLARLIAPDQMGELFKAAAIWAPASAIPPGFEEA